MPARAASPALSEQGFDIAGALAADASNDESDHGDNLSIFKGNRKLQNVNDASSESDDDEAFIAAQQAASNRQSATTGKSAKKSGGFQSMGLNPALLKAITRKGFSVPTPIQRKVIPLILDHQDVVGMARTGSGKTAAFVIPMIERLKTHSVKVGARAILLSPSRELALQTLKAVKELGKGTNLRTILLVGGDSLDDHFTQMTSNPDIIIATPGRFLHLLVEMSLDLSSIKYIVFDEADRLFEMGFATQLTEILHALPASRQTLLFSATLPKSLVEFAKAGLKDPSLVRLDAESKISPDLESAFMSVKSNDKEGALLHLIRDILKVPPRNADVSNQGDSVSRHGVKRKRGHDNKNAGDIPTAFSTIVFTATKYHVEYISSMLTETGYNVSFVYGNLDQAARKSQVDKFRAGITNIMVVTDIAARGIDIPLLANVINYDFPSQPKVYVHRVGRTARAGRRGWAYSLVQESDLAYLLDLQLFLGRRLVQGRQETSKVSFAEDVVLGAIPPQRLEDVNEIVARFLDESEDLQAMKRVAEKGEKQYLRSRNAASKQSAWRSKEVVANKGYNQPHLIYGGDEDHQNVSEARDRMLATISSFRPNETVFEISARGQGNETTETIQRTRARIREQRDRVLGQDSSDAEVDAYNGNDDTLEAEQAERAATGADGTDSASSNTSEDDSFVLSISGHKTRRSKSDPWQDEEHFMGYQPKTINAIEDRGYGVHSGGVSKATNFTDAARGATMDLGMDEDRSYAEASRPNQMRWDKKNKKYVSRTNDEDGSKGSKMIRGESGQKIAASFRSGRFDAWKKSQRLNRLPRTGETEDSRVTNHLSQRHYKHHSSKSPKLPDRYRDDFHQKRKRVGEGVADGGRGAKNELHSVDDVRKARALKQKRLQKNARPSRKRKA